MPGADQVSSSHRLKLSTNTYYLVASPQPPHHYQVTVAFVDCLRYQVLMSQMRQDPLALLVQSFYIVPPSWAKLPSHNATSHTPHFYQQKNFF